nr:rlpA-like double-psi beta-barrel domain-containing protein [Ipomoea batatas]
MRSVIGALLVLLILAISTHSVEPKPQLSGEKAVLTINSFEKGGDGGGPSECDGHYHSDDTLIVALSTRWYNHGHRCHNYITINGNGRSVKAMVVDECDSNGGCANNIVDASKAVWKALAEQTLGKTDSAFYELSNSKNIWESIQEEEEDICLKIKVCVFDGKEINQYPAIEDSISIRKHITQFICNGAKIFD